MKIEGFIYKYISPNGKIYIGQTTNEAERRKRFLDSNEIYSGKKMQKERLLCPNLEEWKYEIIEHIEADSYLELGKQLDFLEAKYILELDTIENGLNVILGNPHFPISNNKLFIKYIQSKYNDEIIIRYFRYTQYINNTSGKYGLFASDIHKFLYNLFYYTESLKESRDYQNKYHKMIENFDIDHPKSKSKKEEKINELKKKIAWWEKEENKILKRINRKILNKTNTKKFSKILDTYIVNYCKNIIK